MAGTAPDPGGPAEGRTKPLLFCSCSCTKVKTGIKKQASPFTPSDDHENDKDQAGRGEGGLLEHSEASVLYGVVWASILRA